MTQRCTAQQCMTVWSLECDLTMATTTLMLTQITQSTSTTAQQLCSPAFPAQMWPVLTVPSSSQHRQCQAPSSTQVASMCSDRSTSTVQYCTVQYIVSWPHFTMSTVPHCRQACPAPVYTLSMCVSCANVLPYTANVVCIQIFPCILPSSIQN